MFERSVRFFDTLMRRYTPDPFIFALLLTIVIFISGLVFTPSTPTQMVTYWGSGFWELVTFTLQMAMVLLTGYVIALTPLAKRALQAIASLARTPGQTILIVTLTSLTASLINWGLGLVVGGLLCREIHQLNPKVNFRLLVASSYSGFLVWHGGLSASIPLVLATEGNFSQHLVGGLIPTELTLFSTLNICAVSGLFILIPLCNWCLGRIDKNHGVVALVPQKKIAADPSIRSPADWLEKKPYIALLMSLTGLFYLFNLWIDGKFQLNLNTINTLFLFCGLLLHRTPAAFLQAVNEAAGKLGPILVQFPFYAAIMGMIGQSGLATIISQAFVSLSTADTYALWTFYSAGLLNLFIPSGGGQWAVQAPVVIEAARAIGADIPKAAMAVAWGDAWTNMLQPFWALPLLAIAGLHLRDIMGYCVIILVVSGLYLSGIFMFL
ncbi:TIGR00366 family protein [Alphaproteobacteria bacterium]|nr:TIGR00366 family protein [Alphaproteobacteria bacterium]